MGYLFSHMSLLSYSIVILIVGIIFVYGLIDMKKKKPGHPFTNALYGILVLGLYTVPYRVIQECSANLLLINLSRNLLYVLSAIVLVLFIYFAYLAYKKGFLAEKEKQLLRNTLLPCGIVIAIGIVIIVVAYYFMCKHG